MDETAPEGEPAPVMTAHSAEKILNAHQRLEELARDWQRYVGTPLNENITVHVMLYSGADEECMTIRELRELLESVLPDAKLALARKASKAWQDIANEQAAELADRRQGRVHGYAVEIGDDSAIHVACPAGTLFHNFASASAPLDGILDAVAAHVGEHEQCDAYAALPAAQDAEDEAFHAAMRERRRGSEEAAT